MAAFADNLARLRVAATTGALPADLGRWVVQVVEGVAPAAERIEERNALLRAAADRLAGSRWAKARRLEQEIRGAALAPRRGATDDVGRLVAEAVRIAPAPTSLRQLLRLLA